MVIIFLYVREHFVSIASPALPCPSKLKMRGCPDSVYPASVALKMPILTSESRITNLPLFGFLSSLRCLLFNVLLRSSRAYVSCVYDWLMHGFGKPHKFHGKHDKIAGY
jgi:hypothetical protein